MQNELNNGIVELSFGEIDEIAGGDQWTYDAFYAVGSGIREGVKYVAEKTSDALEAAGDAIKGLLE